MTLKQKSKGVYFDNSFDPVNFDSIIFDCDGVLIDITNSYDETIIKTTKHILETFAKIHDSIDIDFKTITLDKISVKFESKYEERIQDIAVTANLATLDYSLKLWSTIIE